MPIQTIIYGIVLIAISAVSYTLSDVKSPTALIPAGMGIVAWICGVMALKNIARMHVMHVAALIGLMGIIMPGMRLLKTTPSAGIGFYALLGTVIASVIFLVLCIRSFKAARKAKES